MEFKTAAELGTFLSELQGQMQTLQETVDKIAPVAEEEEEEVTPDDTVTDEEVNEIDALLQSE